MPAETYHEFPLSSNRSWDENAAMPELKRWASSDGSGDKDKINWQKMKQVHFWHETGELSDFGQMKFPYCRIENGEPHVVHDACQNTMSRCDSSNIPESDKPAVKRVAKRQMDRFDNMQMSNNANYSSGTSDTPQYGIPTPEQLAKINKLAKRTLSADEVFVWPGKLAGDMIIPDRYVQLTRELLDVFAINAQKGVSFLLDHSWHADGFWGMGGRPKAAISYGRTFDSSFGPGTEEGETVSLNADTYMKRGVKFDGIETDELIQSIESGTLFDTSIGFSYNCGICSICGNDYSNPEKCSHYAGKTYEVEGDDGVTRNMLCWIKAYPPGNLWENSGVFDGAYPGAGMMSTAGDVLENEHGIYQVITDLKDIYPEKPIIATYSPRVGLLTMVKKANHKKPFAIGGLIEQAKASATDRDSIFAIGDRIGVSREQVKHIANLVLKGDENNMFKEMLEKMKVLGIAVEDGKTYSADEIFHLLSENNQKNTQEQIALAKASVIQFVTKEQATEKLGKETTADEVLKLAIEGRDYHQKVVDEAIAMGVRAMGNDFPADTWKNTFATMGTQAINDIAKTWEAQAKTIPAGRVTDPAAGLGNTGNADLPDEAYKVK